jgi:hypothetical protein
MVRKVLVKGIYYCQLLSVTGFFFIFVSTFTNRLNEFYSWNGDNASAKILLGALLLYQLLGLYVIILFKRYQMDNSSVMFILKLILAFFAFIVPSICFLILSLLASSGVE